MAIPVQLKRIGALAASVALLIATGPANQAADAGLAQPALVSSIPAKYTPHLKTGYIVHEAEVVGGTVYLGGQFTQFENASRTVTYDRQNFVAYSATTGAVSPLTLNFNKDVYAIAGSPDGSTLYIGGSFTTVNGVARNRLIKVDVATGAIDPLFKGTDGSVRDLQYIGGKLYVGGLFSKRLMAVNPSTGADTGQISVSVTGSLSGYAPSVRQFAINPSATDMVVIGDFTTVNGQSRNSAFRLTLGATSSTLSSWHPQRFDAKCALSIPYYMRGVDWSPDGSYFVIVSSGGPVGYPSTGFCDGAGRWEASSTGSVAEPTWINWTGGDSLYSVAISGAAVYVGGHNRWLDNPFGHDTAGPGAYKVNSLGAIDPTTGAAIKTWNTGWTTRGHGKEDLALFPGGLVAAGDGTLVNGSYHSGNALFPL